MRRRPMQVWPRGQRNAGGSRALLALVVFALLAMLVPSSAAAATPTISYSIDGIAGDQRLVEGQHARELHRPPLDRRCQPTADEHRRLRSPSRADRDAPACPRQRDGTSHGVTINATARLSDPSSDATAGQTRRLSGRRSRSQLHPGYSGPDGATATATGTCRDKAGNVGSALPAQVRRHPPVLSKVGVTSRAASDLVRWTSTSPADTAVVQRWPRGGTDQPVVFRGARLSTSTRRSRPGSSTSTRSRPPIRQATPRSGSPSRACPRC